MGQRFTPGDFTNGLLYAIANRPLTSLRTGPRFDAALYGAYIRLRQLEADYDLDVSFAAAPDEWGHSITLSSALDRAAQRGLLSYDYLDVMIDRRVIHALIDIKNHPATLELYEELAAGFFDSYNRIPALVE